MTEAADGEYAAPGRPLPAPPGRDVGVGAVGAHLVLVGLPGAGKSTVGPLVAEQLGARFLDFDEEIVRRTGKTIPELFATQGEAYFRRLEREITAELRGRPAAVLAPGGGWMTDAVNVALIRPPSRIIHLRVGVEVAVRRLGTEKATRPLLQGSDPVEQMARLWAERSPVYAGADSQVETQLITPPQVADLVSELATRWGWPVG